MSVSSVGAFGFGDASQILTKMLSRLDSTQPTASNTSESEFGNATSSISQPSASDASNNLTGATQSQLSDQIVAMMVQLQQQSQTINSQRAGEPAANVPQVSGPDGSNPVQQLFTAIDANGDGSISQSEMENYIEAQGGTQTQGDTLFSSLSQNGASGISENQLAGEASQAPHMHHGHHHHMQGGDTQNSSSSDLASQLFGSLDSNQDGVLSASELAFGTNLAGPGTSAVSTDSGASNLLSEIDSNGDGSVSNTEFTTFVSSLEQQIGSDAATMDALISRAVNAYSAAANNSTSLTQMQSTVV